MRTAIGAAIIRKGEILLVRKKESWILPGGKPELEESDMECLHREFGEELPGTKLNNPQFYGTFEGVTPHTKDTIRVRVYLADIEGEIGQPAREIAESAWTGNPRQYNLSDITRKIMDSLIENRYLG